MVQIIPKILDGMVALKALVNKAGGSLRLLGSGAGIDWGRRVRIKKKMPEFQTTGCPHNNITPTAQECRDVPTATTTLGHCMVLKYLT